jgi:hypothetical protein
MVDMTRLLRCLLVRGGIYRSAPRWRETDPGMVAAKEIGRRMPDEP